VVLKGRAAAEWCAAKFCVLYYCSLLFGAESFVFQFAIKNLNIKIYRTIILAVVSYGCETRSLILREEAEGVRE
jgi:hypothetical protein